MLVGWSTIHDEGNAVVHQASYVLTLAEVLDPDYTERCISLGAW